MGGKKRKISMEKKIDNKDSRSVAFSKRRYGLYSKTSELCLLSGAQVAILATPVSSQSYVSFYSFGHSSVDSVVSAFLANQPPPPQEGLGLGFWWEDESVAKSEDTKELSDAVDSISRMLQNLKGLHSAAVEKREDKKKKKKKKKKDLVVHGTHQELSRDQTLNLQPTCASVSIHDDQISAISDINNGLVLGNLDGCNQELDLDQIIDYETNGEGLTMNFGTGDGSTNQHSCAASICIHDANFKEDRIVTISDIDNNGLILKNLDGCNQELDLHQIIDFETKGEGLTMNLEMDDVSTNRNSSSDSEDAQDGALVICSNSNKDNNLHFSDLDEDQIIAISDNNNNNNTKNGLSKDLHGHNEVLDLDQILDFVKDGADRVLDQDNLQFSEYFNELASIVAL